MRVVFLLDNLGSGGMQLQFVNLLPAVVAANHEVLVVLYNADPQGEFYDHRIIEQDCTLVRIPRRIGFKWDLAAKLRRVLNDYVADVVVSFLPAANFYITLSKALMLFDKTRFRHICVDMSVYTRKTPLSVLAAGILSYYFSDVQVCNSKTQVLFYSKLPLASVSRLKYIPNGVDVKHYYVGEENWRSVVPNLLVVGRVTPAKNGPNFVRALGFVVNVVADLKVTWVGRVDSGAASAREKAQMDSEIERLCSKGLTWIWAGEVADVRPFYKDASFLVIPSEWEGVPNVLLEAMLSGCSIIATDISDLRQILGEGARGAIAKSPSVEDIAEAILMCLKMSEDQLFDIRRRSQTYAEKEFGLEKMGTNYLALFDDLAK